MAKKKRLSPEIRKKAILDSAISLFAGNGFKGTTTKQLADAADVSEALLFKYFKNKETLYNELKFSVFSQLDIAENTLPDLTPSTAALVIIIYAMLFEMLGISYDKDEYNNFNRLLSYSLLEDGEFAKMFYRSRMETMLPYIIKHLIAAKKAGNLKESSMSDENKIHFIHHFAVGFIHVNYQDIVDYKLTQEELIEQMTVFSLRAIGLTEKAIQKHFNPELFFQLFF